MRNNYHISFHLTTNFLQMFRISVSKMLSLRFLVFGVLFSAGFAFINNPKLFGDDQKLCQKLNNSMFDEIGSILDSPDYTGEADYELDYDFRRKRSMTNMKSDKPENTEAPKKPTNMDRTAYTVREYYFFR